MLNKSEHKVVLRRRRLPIPYDSHGIGRPARMTTNGFGPRQYPAACGPAEKNFNNSIFTATLKSSSLIIIRFVRRETSSFTRNPLITRSSLIRYFPLNPHEILSTDQLINAILPRSVKIFASRSASNAETPKLILTFKCNKKKSLCHESFERLTRKCNNRQQTRRNKQESETHAVKQHF